MPTLLLRSRAQGLRERMDDPHCDPERLANTYAQFSVVNGLLSGWERVFGRRLLPFAGRRATLLDVGCGGGDLARKLTLWAQRAGVELSVTGIDPDPRALAFARGRAAPPTVRFRRATVGELAAAGERFDFVVSNHLLHHLGPSELPAFLADCRALTAVRAVHNDIRRSDLALVGFALGTPFFRRSFVIEDGLRSIRRSFTQAELRALAPEGWRVERLEPFRNLLVYDA